MVAHNVEPLKARIRDANDGDIQAITDIYNEAVVTFTSTADLRPQTLDERRAWVESHRPRAQYPVVVITDGDGTVVGFGSLSRYNYREGYDGVLELSYYIAGSARRRGYGSAMVEWLVARAKKLGAHMAVALIFAINDGSNALMRKYGFTRFGMLPQASWDGKGYLDVNYWYQDLR
ncbi:GNAT family N-acetyltransferase [Bifidobacterium sp. ESL0763]|uniref:GNAT family N-acetyltransferase n=1 Tax=Bifidobacterium sp. ESL0763 TaxID=2983227 RepID=UPI0023F9A5BC|nr:GNAT family N-acetyltransferase [Bifidobacterium sp. ESL0763]MDF7664000.1 GNAT family N-acetyltransferase [Bifidobacterium sp. ESL0763]